jgi:hypothetical protein
MTKGEETTVILGVGLLAVIGLVLWFGNENGPVAAAPAANTSPLPVIGGSAPPISYSPGAINIPPITVAGSPALPPAAAAPPPTMGSADAVTPSCGCSSGQINNFYGSPSVQSLTIEPAVQAARTAILAIAPHTPYITAEGFTGAFSPYYPPTTGGQYFG